MPLVNSGNKVTRIFGYIIYAFIFLFIVGLILPSEDETGTKVQAPASSNSIGGNDKSASASSGGQFYSGFGSYTLDSPEKVTVSIKKSNDMFHLMSMGELPTDSWFTKDSKSYTITSTESNQLKGYIDYTDDGYVVVLKPNSRSLTKGDFKEIVESFRREEE